MAFDLKIVETGNGGDFVNKGDDLAITESVSTMIYLALFGGNVEESTITKTIYAESFDWWANRLLMSSEPSQMFNSLTEKTLNKTALNTEGRTIIENAVIEDLKFLAKIFAIFVKVKLPSLNHVTIEITITKLDKSKEATLIINLKKSLAGDFSIFDFDASDFLI